MGMEATLQKYMGCLLAGAAGDALGYAVEFMDEAAIFRRHGAGGITSYELWQGKALISDDTQMTLFTAQGLLDAGEEGALEAIANAYRCWYLTQYWDESIAVKPCRLLQVRELYARRAPGNTCLSAIRGGCSGTPEAPLNRSKGCGGVMRVAPIGLWAGEDVLQADLLGAHAAALTHGHPMGYIPAAMLVHMVAKLAGEGMTPKEAALDAMAAMERLFPHEPELPGFLERMGEAVRLSESAAADLDAIHALGEGWVGDEALAIAVYCALRYPQDLERCLIAAVNHRGDSDSTGAIAGNILGAYLGADAIPEKFLQNLELKDTIAQIAAQLHTSR